MINPPNYITDSPEETIQLGFQLAHILKPGDSVLLTGELGSGKTHFSKGIANGLGVNSVIKSPTYVYVNSYRLEELRFKPAPVSTGRGIKDLRLYHYDLYRFEPGDDIGSIGLEETIDDESALNVIEWAERLTSITPRNAVFVDFTSGDSEFQRNITMRFVRRGQVLSDQIEAFYEEWVTPMHVRRHMKKVTQVAMQMATEFVKNGVPVNTDLLYSACMLHDLARVCDFNTLDKKHFDEEVTAEKWSTWTQMRERYQGRHHADIATDFFREKGYPDTAELIRLHRSLNLVLDPDAYTSLESKLIYYADKRVKHEEIVSLAERFRDGRVRNGRLNDVQKNVLFDEVETKTYLLEKELFGGLGIEAEGVDC